MTKYLTTEEVAEHLRVYPGTVKRWLREGKLAGVSLGSRAGWRVSEDALAAFVRRQSNVPHGDDQGEEEGKAAA